MITRGWVAPGQVHQYQSAVVRDSSRLVVVQKSRRIGISWALLGRAVMRGARPNGTHTYYMSHTYDSGLEAMSDVEWWADRIDLKARLEGRPSIWLGGSKEKGLSKETARFAGGGKIKILSSKPRKVRGITGAPDYILDELAFHLEPEAMLDAAMPILLRPMGSVTVLSTVMTENDAFYQFCEKTREEIGKFGSVRTGKNFHKITFDDALEHKFMEREAWVVAQAVAEGYATPDKLIHVQDRGLAKHLEGIVTRGVYGLDAYDGIDGRSLYRQHARLEYKERVWRLVSEPDRELSCIPSQSGAQYMSKDLIKRAGDEHCKVFRFEADHAFVESGWDYQETQVRRWMADNCYELEQLRTNPGRKWFYGVDFGRTRDLTVIGLGYIDGKVLRVPFMLELGNVPFRAQREFFDQVVRRLDIVAGGALDKGGNGGDLAEHASNTLGEHRAEGVQLSKDWYIQWMPGFKRRFQDSTIAIPEDDFVASDLRQIKLVDGVPRVPRGERQNVGKALDGKTAKYRHGDAAVSLALLNYAAHTAVANGGKYESRNVGLPPGRAIKGLG
jgi:phage FluMu gp28-like protein